MHSSWMQVLLFSHGSRDHFWEGGIKRPGVARAARLITCAQVVGQRLGVPRTARVGTFAQVVSSVLGSLARLA